MKAKIIQTLNEFKATNGQMMGAYLVELDGKSKHIITRNGDVYKTITHFFDHDELNIITIGFKNAIIEALNNK